MNGARLLLAAAGVLVTFATGCPATQLPSTGSFDRPSGMAYVVRSSTRADLLIADAAAGGVRVVQLQVAQSNATPPRPVYQHVFERAPAQYFPVVIPAGRFPTRVAASGDGRRAFGLSSVDGTLSRLQVPVSPFDRSSVESSGAIADAQLDLSTLPGVSGLPVDLVPLDPMRFGVTDDVVGVVFDRPDGAGELVVLAIDAAGQPRVLARTRVGPGPRDLALRAAAPAGLWVSSALSSTVSFVPFTTGAAVFGPVQGLDAGGPTGTIVDAGEGGAIALRLDLPVVSVFDLDGDVLRRSTRVFLTPASLIGGEVGQLRVFALPMAAGLGYFDFLPSPSSASTNLLTSGDLVPSRNKAPVILIVESDGSAEFLAGLPLHPVFVESGRLVRIEPVERGALKPADSLRCTVRETPSFCSVPGTRTTSVTTRPACTAPAVEDVRAGGLILRAVVEGALVEEAAGTLIRSSSTTITIEPYATSAAARLVQPGDTVRFRAQVRQSCASGASLALVDGTATVTALQGEAVVARLGPISPDPAVLEAGLGCGPLALGSLVIHPADQSIVLQRLEGDLLSAVLERVRPTRSSTPTQYVLQRGVSLTLTTTTSGALRCTEVTQGLPCRLGSECGGRSCQRTDAELSNNCAGVCLASCSEVDYPECVPEPARRWCPAVEFQTRGASQLRVPGNFSIDANTANLPLQARLPEDVVFSEIRNSWIVSFPGGRSVVELAIIQSATAGEYTYQTIDFR